MSAVEAKNEAISVVTGASGMLGRHVVEALRSRGRRIRAVVRPVSETAALEGPNVEIMRAESDAVDGWRKAVRGADTVYHCAAFVSDWGTWKQFRDQIVDLTRRLLEACRAEGVRRVVYVSSISVYGNPSGDEELVEDSPLGRRFMIWDHYARAKLLAEEVCREFGELVTIVRPCMIYGRYDRKVVPRFVAAIRAGKARIIGSGDNEINMLHASDVAEAMILAADHPGAAGRVYNLSSEGEVKQRDLLNMLTDALGLPRVERHISKWLILRIAFMLEAFGKLIGRKRPPMISRRGVYIVARPTRFSSRRAKEELGWRRKVDVLDGTRDVLAWMAENGN